MNKAEKITLDCANGKPMGFYHAPHEGRLRGGFLLLMEIFGVNPNMRARARQLAAMGYDVLAPYLYDFVEKDFVAEAYSPENVQRAMALAKENGAEGGLPGIAAAVDYFNAEGKKKIFMGGYCYGGSVAWLAACRTKGLAAVSCFYGRLIPEYRHETPQCPTICHFGKQDLSIPLEGVEKLKTAQPDVPVYLYDAGHGFCSDRPEHFNEAACKLARSRAVALFQANE